MRLECACGRHFLAFSYRFFCKIQQEYLDVKWTLFGLSQKMYIVLEGIWHMTIFGIEKRERQSEVDEFC